MSKNVQLFFPYDNYKVEEEDLPNFELFPNMFESECFEIDNNAELDEINNFIGDNVNKNTEKKTKSDLCVWQRCISQDQNIHETRKMEDIPPERLDILLSLFFMRFRKQDREEYEPQRR